MEARNEREKLCSSADYVKKVSWTISVSVVISRVSELIYQSSYAFCSSVADDAHPFSFPMTFISTGKHLISANYDVG